MTPLTVLRRYLVFQGMTFVFGIVGPIFLVIFFTVPRDPGMKWMYFIGLFITAADVLIALGLTQNWVNQERLAQERRSDRSHLITP
ncbi:hypothetical protein [Mycolicibacterium fluoranthenivorans]|uniref:Uncharacterized protein n=1 Tax=Mycolicibacterium fluoranthenivorans TaxID=258505 RepID=A0A7X5ZBA6_9MYCO|nr:hypothetical protein [Mycolicibacterium fluoranthenivorans]MCV7356713.1 hypothetical protein [Mycolicibacterium fluoranthenivorans]NIH94105.1 hypothetical protein [Mycolicibacterium fluoranthenivorans]